MSGGAGADYFGFTSLTDSVRGSNRDVISDWTSGTDKIDLHAIDANTKTVGDQAFSWIGTKGFTGKAGQLHTAFDGPNTVIEGDVNGDRIADFQIQLNGKFSLAAGDFIL
jgi:serralysin